MDRQTDRYLDKLSNMPQLMYGVSAMGRLLVEQVSSCEQTDIHTDRYLDKFSNMPQLMYGISALGRLLLEQVDK